MLRSAQKNKEEAFCSFFPSGWCSEKGFTWTRGAQDRKLQGQFPTRDFSSQYLVKRKWDHYKNQFERGNIKLWPHNYAMKNVDSIPNAFSDIYDSGDQPIDPADRYACMQIHNYGA